MNNELVCEKTAGEKEINSPDDHLSKNMQELEQFMKAFGQNINESKNYDKFQNIDDNLLKMKETLDNEEEILKDFQVLDETGSGYINFESFRFILKKMDKKFSDEEIEEMIIESSEISEMGEERINYKNIIKKFL